LGEILADRFRERRIGVTAVLAQAPVDRVRTHWPARAAELDFMLLWRTPRHVEEFLRRAIGKVFFEPGNRLRAMMLWGDGAPPLQADSCIFAQVHLDRQALESELEASGFTIASETIQGAPGGRPVGATSAPAQPQQPRERRHGPKRGVTGFRSSDFALCPRIDQMMTAGGARSAIAAARILAKDGSVHGKGTPENRAIRLARRYGEWKSAAESSEG
jgi:hypothetical protein